MNSKYKLEAVNDPQYLTLETGDLFHGLRILHTVKGSNQFIVEAEDEAEIVRLQGEGRVVDFRPAHVGGYGKLGWPVVLPLNTSVRIGDTFPLLGRTPAVQRRGNWGAKRLGHVDTWVDPAHPLFHGKRLVINNRFGPDSEDHGTHTIGTAAGLEGFATDAEMWSFNALPRGLGDEDWVAEGITWCADEGCDVITLSLGGPPSQVIDAAVMYARQRGCWVVAAAGNSGPNTRIGSPARSATLVVLSCDRRGRPSSFTEGRQWDRPHRVYCYGEAIVGPILQGGLGAMSGTSMATPQVAGMLLHLRAAKMSESEMLQYVESHLEAVA